MLFRSPVRDGAQLRNTIGLTRIGDPVTLVVERGGAERTIEVKVAEATNASGKGGITPGRR